jgi:hypothetical protein
LQDFDPGDMSTEVGVGTSVISTSVQHHASTPITQNGTSPRVDFNTTPGPDEHILECARDDVDVEDRFAHFEACFSLYSRITSTKNYRLPFW